MSKPCALCERDGETCQRCLFDKLKNVDASAAIKRRVDRFYKDLGESMTDETIDIRERFLALSEALPESSIAGCAARWAVFLLDDRDSIAAQVDIANPSPPADQARALFALHAKLSQGFGNSDVPEPPPTTLPDGMCVLTLSRDDVDKVETALGNSPHQAHVDLANRIVKMTKPPPVYTLRGTMIYKARVAILSVLDTVEAAAVVNRLNEKAEA